MLSTKVSIYLLVINLDECIDYAVCVPECQAEAIFAEDDVPEGQLAYIAINAEMSRKWLVITRSKIRCPMPGNGGMSGTESYT